MVFRLAREERDTWLNWPARVAALMAAELGVDAHAMQKARRDACPRSPRRTRRDPDPNSDELIGFDGGEELCQAWCDGLTPDPSLTISQWADRTAI